MVDNIIKRTSKSIIIDSVDIVEIFSGGDRGLNTAMGSISCGKLVGSEGVESAGNFVQRGVGSGVAREAGICR